MYRIMEIYFVEKSHQCNGVDRPGCCSKKKLLVWRKKLSSNAGLLGSQSIKSPKFPVVILRAIRANN